MAMTPLEDPAALAGQQLQSLSHLLFGITRLDVGNAHRCEFLAGVAEVGVGRLIELDEARGLRIDHGDGIRGLIDDGVENILAPGRRSGQIAAPENTGQAVGNGVDQGALLGQKGPFGRGGPGRGVADRHLAAPDAAHHDRSGQTGHRAAQVAVGMALAVEFDPGRGDFGELPARRQEGRHVADYIAQRFVRTLAGAKHGMQALLFLDAFLERMLGGFQRGGLAAHGQSQTAEPDKEDTRQHGQGDQAEFESSLQGAVVGRCGRHPFFPQGPVLAGIDQGRAAFDQGQPIGITLPDGTMKLPGVELESLAKILSGIRLSQVVMRGIFVEAENFDVVGQGASDQFAIAGVWAQVVDALLMEPVDAGVAGHHTHLEIAQILDRLDGGDVLVYEDVDRQVGIGRGEVIERHTRRGAVEIVDDVEFARQQAALGFGPGQGLQGHPDAGFPLPEFPPIDAVTGRLAVGVDEHKGRVIVVGDDPQFLRVSGEG